MIDLREQTVLVVDDQEFVRTIVRGMLKQLGIVSVVEAADGAQALSVVREHAPHVIICDVQMRPVDGFGFVRMLRETEACRTLPVIMLTAHADSATVERARDLHIDAFISKPVLPATLAQTITQVLGRHPAG